MQSFSYELDGRTTRRLTSARLQQLPLDGEQREGAWPLTRYDYFAQIKTSVRQIIDSDRARGRRDLDRVGDNSVTEAAEDEAMRSWRQAPETKNAERIRVSSDSHVLDQHAYADQRSLAGAI